MKKNLYKFILAIGIIIGCNPYQILGQCVSSFNNPSGTINVSPMVQTIISGSMNQNEYAVINIVTAGEYQVNTSFGTHLNVTDNANVSLASGNNPLSVNFPTAGLYRVHVTPFGCASNNFSGRIVAISPKNRAFNLDGTDDFIDCGIAVTNALKGKDKLTVEAWVYPTQNSVGKSILGNHQSNTQFNIQHSSTNQFNFFIGFGTYAVTTASNSVVLNTWQHIAGVFDDNVLRFYINGVLSGTTAVPSSYVLNASCNTNVWIGKSAFGGENFQGSIDEVRIWDRAVCQGEIQKNMNGIIPTTATNLLANYHFEHGVIGGNNATVTTLVDYSGNAYDGTVTNAALNGAISNWVASGAYPANGAAPLVDVAPAYTPPTISISGATSICNGASTTFTASGSVATYNWLSGPTTATNTVSPTTTTSYSVVGTNSLGCLSNTATITLTVNSLPTISVNSGSICSGSSFTMIPSGASTYTFSGGSSVVSPTANASYTVTGTSASGCESSTGAVSSVTVSSLPVVSVNSGSICSGTSFTMTPSGALTYTYTGGSAIVSPTTTTSYSVTGTNASGCVSTPAVSNVTVNVCTSGAALNFSGGANTRVDLGSGLTTSLAGGTKVSLEAWVKPTSLSGTGCIIGNYSTGTSSNLQILLRRGNGFYEFWVGNGASWYQTTSVATPTINVWQHVAATWDGTVAKIYVNGVLSGTTTPAISTLGTAVGNPAWIGGNTGGENFTGNIDEVRVWNVARTQCEINTYKNCEIPTTSTGLLANYHFNQGVDAGTNTGVTTLTDASASAFTGTLTNFALSGATSNWVAPGGVTSGSVTPANLAITVGSTVTNSVICSGNSTTLSGTGANTYVWTGGVTNAVSFTPTVTNTYTVTGTNTLTGCTNTAVSSVTVNALPSVAANTTNALCNGGSGSATVTATGGTSPYTYLASNGATVSAQSGLMPGSYTYTVTDANSCVKTQTLSITEPSAIITTSAVTNALCNGGTGSATVTATGGTGAYTYLASNGATVSVQSGLMAGTYNYTVTDANACEQTQILSITEPSVINLSTSANNATICAGAGSTLTANATGGTGTLTYTWVSGPTSNVNTVTPTATAVYTVDVTDANNCVTTSTVEVTVNALPTISVNSGSICAGQSFTMVPTGATTYTYSNGTDVVTPAANDSYTVTGTDANGCVSATGAVSTVTVNALPVLTAVTNNTLLCVGQTATLSVNGATTYTWSTTENTASIAVSPTVQTTYTVSGTDANGCSNNTTVTQDVSACTGIATLTNDASINVYPNPNNGLFVIELTSVSKVTVMNALGQVVITETFEAGKHTVNINNESTGVYFVKVMTNNKQQIIKVIKE